MSRWTLRLGLSLFVSVSCWTNRLPAQAPQAAPAQTTVAPATPSNVASMPVVVVGDAEASPCAASRSGPLRGLFNRAGVCCQNNYNGACSSLAAECRFVFGSCRAFFGEPCVPNSPRSWRAPR